MNRRPNIKDAKATRGGNWLKAGDFLLEVDCNKEVTDRHGGMKWISEFNVLESNNPEQPPGSHVEWCADYKFDSSAGNVKAYLMAVADCDEDDLDDESVDKVVSEENPLKGARVRANAFEITTRKGNPFTKVNWLPV